MAETEPKKVQKPTPNIKIMTFQPLDFSFMDIKDIRDLPKCEPRITAGINLVIHKSQSGKWITQTLKVNNNHIGDITSIPSVVGELFENISNLTWLDVSCNKISAIPNTICNLKSLRIIYMHGNEIKTFQDVSRLKPLSGLSKLTLHGNPVEKEKGYFHTVLSILPNLITLDFTGISPVDQQTAALIRRPYNQSKRSKEE
ncbi:unnamed protein product [Trichobilharzia szidati]|nr:unnamed protein product [Trichobilharzia szidati]